MLINKDGYKGILFTTKYCTCKNKDKNNWERLTDISGKYNVCLVRCNKCLNQWYGKGKYVFKLKKSDFV